MAGVPGIIKRTVTVDGISITAATTTVNGNSSRKYQASVNNGLTAVPTGIAAFTRATTLLLLIDSATGPGTVYTNNSVKGSATDVFNVGVNNEILWWQGAPTAIPLTADVTNMWGENLGTVPTVITIVVVLQV